VSARDELALELFIGDNGNQPREASIADWEYFQDSNNFQGRVEHYEVMADAILTAGYTKPRIIGYVVVDRDGGFIRDFGLDIIAATGFVSEWSEDCKTAGIDWEYRIATITEASA
jgi:hypothetical protein